MDACTRPSHTRRQTRAANRLRLAALLSCAAVALSLVASPSLPAAITDLAPENEQTGSISPSSQHEVALRPVAAGQEMALLSARLTDDSAAPIKDLNWRVRNSAGDVVYDGSATTAAIALQPGYYSVEARFGAVRLDETFTVLEGNSIDLRFVLNAGAVRILPRIKGPASPEITSQTRVYALTGKARGTLVSQSDRPGEIINLAAGQYRIESRMLAGNAVAVIDVKIQPGVMSAVEIDHRAGLARFAYVGAPSAKVEWEISRGSTAELTHLGGLNASVVLLPGDYVVTARIGKESLTASFAIKEGEARDIMLGN